MHYQHYRSGWLFPSGQPTIWQTGFELPWPQWFLFNCSHRAVGLSSNSSSVCGLVQTASHMSVTAHKGQSQLVGGPMRSHSQLADVTQQMMHTSWPDTVIPRWRTSSSSRVWVSKASAFHFVWRTVCCSYTPLNLPTATEHIQSPLYGSGTVFCSTSHLLRHFPSSALAWRHTSSNSITCNYCCHARKVTLSFYGHVNRSYLLTYNSRTCMAGSPS